MIIGLSGRMQSGKNTTAAIINQLTNNMFVEKGFATKLKECASIITGITRADFERIEVKNSIISPDWGDLTVRKFLQLFGTEVGRAIHPNFWINALFADYEPIDRRTEQDPDDSNITYPNWIITDVRFPNEGNAIRSRGGILIRLRRNHDVHSEHASETALDDCLTMDYYIDNTNTTIDELIAMVRDILIAEKIIKG